MVEIKDGNLRFQRDLVQCHEHNVAQKHSKLVEELAAVKAMNKFLEHEVSKLRKVATDEQERARLLERDFSDNPKQIRMLNSGSKDLDQILSMGQPAKVNWGLR